MLSTEISPLPGARVVTGLRTHARAARRLALIALSGSIALPASVQMLAERAATREETLPYAIAALLLSLASLPALAATQAVWGVRMRRVRRRELELYAVTGAPLTRALSRLGVAACWAVTLLLGYTVPRLFRESGLYGTADTLTRAVELLTLAGYVAAVFFATWWARGALSTLVGLARSGRSPGDPWDPDNARHPTEPNQTHAQAARPSDPAAPDTPTLPFATPMPMSMPVPTPTATATGTAQPYRMKQSYRMKATIRAARRPAVTWTATALAVVALLGGRAHLWEPAALTVGALLLTALVCGVVTGE
ncbi:hypothetical protein ACIBKY_17205 [Nonomuraea sp. NPDC050394]|uniref:hypothetical protein n=1 Tax=Nonomuraea sp. NPDC050394 TaxID=3364363 RepID=UPI0037A0FB50